jgi:hypothetical protein
MSIPPIGQPPGSESSKETTGGGKPGEPHFVIRESTIGVIKGPYFVLIDSEGNEVFESNVYIGGEEENREEFCRDGAERELQTWIKKGKLK